MKTAVETLLICVDWFVLVNVAKQIGFLVNGI